MRSPCTAMKSSSHLLQLEKVHAQQRRPNTAKKKDTKMNYKCNFKIIKLLGGYLRDLGLSKVFSDGTAKVGSIKEVDK